MTSKEEIPLNSVNREQNNTNQNQNQATSKMDPKLLFRLIGVLIGTGALIGIGFGINHLVNSSSETPNPPDDLGNSDILDSTQQGNQQNSINDQIDQTTISQGDNRDPNFLYCMECQSSGEVCNDANDNGVSTKCPKDTVACLNGTSDTQTTRSCGPIVTLPQVLKMNECVQMDIIGDDTKICACNTNDCNSMEN